MVEIAEALRGLLDMQNLLIERRPTLADRIVMVSTLSSAELLMRRLAGSKAHGAEAEAAATSIEACRKHLEADKPSSLKKELRSTVRLVARIVAQKNITERRKRGEGA